MINNSIVSVIDKKGHEMIVTGKGIGFQRKRGEFIEESLVERVYRMEDKASSKKLRDLLEEIPLEHLEMTKDLIEEIRLKIPHPLNESLLITLADHISFAIRRKEEGLVFKNPLEESIRSYYPTEYHLGQYCLRVIRERYGSDLAADEAAFIALHIVNAELNTDMTVMTDITNLISGALQVVECYYKKTFDRESLDFSRFVVHLRYFAQRLFRDEILEDGEEEHDLIFRDLVARNSKIHYKCAECIGEFVWNTYHRKLSAEELTYLAIHLRRINIGGER